jgi:hypothetical protein
MNPIECHSGDIQKFALDGTITRAGMLSEDRLSASQDIIVWKGKLDEKKFKDTKRKVMVEWRTQAIFMEATLGNWENGTLSYLPEEYKWQDFA